MKERIICCYSVTNAIKIGGKEIVIGIREKANVNCRYMCCAVSKNVGHETYDDFVTSDDYAEIIRIFGKRISEAAADVVEEYNAIGMIVGKNKEIKECDPIFWEDSIEGKVVVIDGRALTPEYRHASCQLMLCTGGFGARAKARGRMCYCVNLFDANQYSFYRSDILGTVDPETLPNWAKEGLEKALEGECNDT